MVEYLLTTCSCDPNPIDRFGRTPLEVSMQPAGSSPVAWKVIVKQDTRAQACTCMQLAPAL